MEILPKHHHLNLWTSYKQQDTHWLGCSALWAHPPPPRDHFKIFCQCLVKNKTYLRDQKKKKNAIKLLLKTIQWQEYLMYYIMV